MNTEQRLDLHKFLIKHKYDFKINNDLEGYEISDSIFHEKILFDSVTNDLYYTNKNSGQDYIVKFTDKNIRGLLNFIKMKDTDFLHAAGLKRSVIALWEINNQRINYSVSNIDKVDANG